MTAGAENRLDVRVDDDNDRYHRQTLISWWDQERLAHGRFLVIGAGALGNELLKGLALLGAGTIVVVDLDHVENSTLSRCALFRDADEGHEKARVAAGAIAPINPDVTVVPVVGDVRELGLGVFAAVDVALGGLDNREARLHVNQACWKMGVPFVDGAIEGLMGVARTFLPPDSACYECTMSDRDREQLAARRACSLLTREEMIAGRVPTTATSASIVAGIQVQEAVKLLHRDRLDYTFAGQGFAFNGMTHDSYVVTYRATSTASATTPIRGRADRPRRGRRLPRCPRRGSAPTGRGGGARPRARDRGRRALRGVPRTRDGTAPALPAARRVRPLPGVRRAAAAGPGAHDRPGDDELLALRPAELGIPAHDVVTARSGMRRRFFHLGDPASAIGDLERIVA